MAWHQGTSYDFDRQRRMAEPRNTLGPHHTSTLYADDHLILGPACSVMGLSLYRIHSSESSKSGSDMAGISLLARAMISATL
jgi:hypothetical protein